MTTNRRGHRSVLGLALLLAFLAWTTPALADLQPEEDMAPVTRVDSRSTIFAIVQRNSFTQPDEHLRHNIPDLLVTVGDHDVSCDFLAHYQATGGLIRWGFATSEVIEEVPGTLTQYYQRGIVDCQPRADVWRVERRLVWDYIGGGRGGALDLGVEPDLRSEHPGLPLGPWGHRVSNLAVDGTHTGFLDVFNALGGLKSFGLPKTDARLDGHSGATLAINEAAPGIIRQYFQAAVLEHHRGNPEPVQIRFLGDLARDVLYPNGSHLAFESFHAASPLRDAQTFFPEGTSVRAALVALYHATDGDDWNNNSNWLSDAPIGEWYGVTTDDRDRLIELDLSQNQLSGEVPAQIGRLTDLQKLNLWGNQLQGEIPPTIGSLTNLSSLSFWGNHLEGEIPTEIGRLTNLTVLSFGTNALRGELPPELGNLVNLERLYISSNRLEGEIPSEMGNLTNLEDLNLSLNQLRGEIPSELGRLTSLAKLVLWGNQLHGGIPIEFGGLTNLAWLDLEGNRLTSMVPGELGGLTNLTGLYLGANQLTGCIPTELQRIANSDLAELGLPFCGSQAAAQH